MVNEIIYVLKCYGFDVLRIILYICVIKYINNIYVFGMIIYFSFFFYLVF